MVACVRGSDGEVVLMAGTNEVIVRDRALAARLLHAARVTA